MAATGELAKYSIALSIEVIQYYKWLTSEKREFVMSKQVLRSGTSIGANIHEANYAVSKADFIAKMQIALKECSETEYWITILDATGYFDETFNAIKEKNQSIKRMLIATLNTSKKPPNFKSAALRRHHNHSPFTLHHSPKQTQRSVLC